MNISDNNISSTLGEGKISALAKKKNPKNQQKPNHQKNPKERKEKKAI